MASRLVEIIHGLHGLYGFSPRRARGTRRSALLGWTQQTQPGILAAMKKRADIHQLIRALRGSLKRKPGEKPFVQEWAEYKAEERALEDAKWARFETWCHRKQQPAKRRRAKH